MKPSYSLLLLAAALAAPAAISAQTADPNPNYQTQQPAPVQRSAPDYNDSAPYANGPAYSRRMPRQQQQPSVLTLRPAEGIGVRSNAPVQTVTAKPGAVELRLAQGIANVTIHHPAKDTLIQVDLPGGQVHLLKDGLYTFNASTNTVRTLKGEAETTVAGNPKPVKVKENHSIVVGADHKTHSFWPAEARNDLLPYPAAEDRGYAAYGPYGGYYPPYPYAYPYYAYPYYGYPGFGLGFGYYGGFGGFRGGFGGRGFRR